MSAIHTIRSTGMHEDKVKSTWTPLVIAATVIMLTSGTLNTISFKFQNQRHYKHGLVQTLYVFFGEYLNIL